MIIVFVFYTAIVDTSCTVSLWIKRGHVNKETVMFSSFTLLTVQYYTIYCKKPCEQYFDKLLHSSMFPFLGVVLSFSFNLHFHFRLKIIDSKKFK